MDSVYNNPNDAVSIRLHNWITTPPHITLSIDVFDMLKLHLINDECINYIEPTTGNTYLMSLCTTIHFDPIKRIEMIYWLLNHGTDPNIGNIYTKKTAFHILMETLQILNKSIMILITALIHKYSADITIVDGANCIPLGYLATNTYLSVTPYYLLLTHILFDTNPHPYPFQHNPNTRPISFFAFGNKKRFEIEYPLLLPDGSLDPKALKLPFELPEFKLEMISTGYYITAIDEFDQIELNHGKQLPKYEAALYYYYLFTLLQLNQQSLTKQCSPQCLSHPHFYTFPSIIPFPREGKRVTKKQWYRDLWAENRQMRRCAKERPTIEQLANPTRSIHPVPILSIYTILPKLDPSITHHESFQRSIGQKNDKNLLLNDNNTKKDQSKFPIPDESIITNPILPPNVTFSIYYSTRYISECSFTYCYDD